MASYTFYVDTSDAIILIALFDRLEIKCELLRMVGKYRLLKAALTEHELVISKLATSPIHISKLDEDLEEYSFKAVY